MLNTHRPFSQQGQYKVTEYIHCPATARAMIVYSTNTAMEKSHIIILVGVVFRRSIEGVMRGTRIFGVLRWKQREPDVKDDEKVERG